MNKRGVATQFSGNSGSAVFVNLTEAYCILREVSFVELGSLLKDFNALQLEWAMGILLQESGIRGDAGQQMIIGLKGSSTIIDGNALYYRGITTSFRLIRPEAWDYLEEKLTNANVVHRSLLIPMADLETQREFFAIAAGLTLESLDSIILPSNSKEYTYILA